MDKSKISDLLARYNAGKGTREDQVMIEQLIEAGHIDLDELGDVRSMEEKLQRLDYPTPSPDLDVRFYQMLAREQKSSRRFSLRDWLRFPMIGPGVAVAAVTFIVGLALGYALFRSGTPNDSQLRALSSEVNALRETMMLSLLEKESATERLKAVSLTQEMDKASKSVTRALITTLNKDENVNVRLAALEALIPYTADDDVRTELIRSVQNQKSPLVQIALADVMVALQEKSAIPEFEKLLESEVTPDDVKKRIREKIDVII